MNAGKYIAIVFGGRPYTVYPNFKDFVPALKLGCELISVSQKMD